MSEVQANTGPGVENRNENGHSHHPAKWAAVVDDVVIPLPQRIVTAGVIKTQASIPPEFVLVRDHNSPNDVVLTDDETLDLAQGNVFYRLAECEVQPRGHCPEAPKLAFIVDDRPEITIRPDQTGESLRQLFSIPRDARLIRDLQSRDDQDIANDSPAPFSAGPVFYTRQVQAELKITVNARVFTEHDGVKAAMTGLQIATLVYPERPSEARVWFVSAGNREVALDRDRTYSRR